MREEMIDPTAPDEERYFEDMRKAIALAIERELAFNVADRRERTRLLGIDRLLGGGKLPRVQ